ncbi:hypothetical protein [Pseudonocardia asaccharolytica]|uniref:Uncharacterized protein n=1 Tax=Pseudonocardia asaccharolytica DSM 44247 = NBRC 16224 TaxID=1123024 RepID=A0A511CYS0_9PSEU|nr:hypothetical protein [Pseudonocardia asaccharolytica]GEL17691.1 hypothetical protein PA7_15280 [Pseudonocardia asaccharolytica DSM 44247 = NBRC 16224]
MALAVRTGIPPSVWAAEGARVIATAYELLDGSNDGRRADDGPQMSG